MKNAIFGLVVILFFVINGCDSTTTDNNGNNNGTGNNGNNGGNNGNNDGNKGFLELARMDIEDANTVFIAPNPETSKDELYKITDSGNVEEVKYYDEAEEKMPMEKKPTAVYNAGSNYVIVCYGSSEGYLVRKNDGAVFSLKDVGIPTNSAQGGNAYGTKVIQQDILGNIYYGIAPSPYALIKLDTSNPENIIKTIVISQTQGTNGAYDVAPDGTIIYGNFVVRKTNGGLFYATNTSGP